MNTYSDLLGVLDAVDYEQRPEKDKQETEDL